jgi:hypothetical protein
LVVDGIIQPHGVARPGAMTVNRQPERTLDDIQRDIDLFEQTADPVVMAGYEARGLASQRNRPRTPSKRELLDELQRLRREKAMKNND